MMLYWLFTLESYLINIIYFSRLIELSPLLLCRIGSASPEDDLQQSTSPLVIGVNSLQVTKSEFFFLVVL